MIFPITFKNSEFVCSRNLSYLDLSITECFSKSHYSPYEIYSKVIKIAPKNFWSIAYHNLECCAYTMPVGQLVFNDGAWLARTKWIEKEFLRQMEDNLFPVFEKIMFLKMQSSSSIYVRKYLRYCRVTKRCSSSLESRRIFNNLMKILYGKSCQDHDLVVEVLRTVFHSYAMKTHFFTGYYCEEYVEYILNLALRAKFNMWGLLPNHDFVDLWLATDSPVLGCLFKGKVKEMAMFLKFGFQRMPSKNILNPGNFINDNVYCLYISEGAKKNGLTLEILPFGSRSTVKHRDLLALEVLYVVCQMSDVTKCQTWFDCLHLIWKSLPDPYISHAEMYHILEKYVPQDHKENLFDVCLRYRRIFCSGIELPNRPRTLLHLARSTIRSSLLKNFSLPCGILELGLPDKLIAYLNLKY